MAIDWQYQTDCYNRNNKTNFKTPHALLKSLYIKYGSCIKVARELLLAGNTVWTRMKLEKIQLNQKGWPQPTRCETAITKLSSSNIKNMTAKQIAIEIGFSENYTRAVLERININYKKKWIRKKSNVKKPTT